MTRLNLIYFAGLVMGISVLLYVSLLYWLPSLNTDLPTYLHSILGVIIIDTILIFGFYHRFWQWKIWHPWLVPFPNLNGTWTGEICSDWINPDTNKKLEPIPAWLIIRQSFLSIHCTMKTKEMTSESFTAAIEVAHEYHSTTKLIYSYESRPKSHVVERSRSHWGTIIFEFTYEGSKKLEGEYWTSRKTTGQTTFRFTDKRKKYDFPNLGKHPAEEVDAQNTSASTGNINTQGNVGIQINYSKAGNDLSANSSENGGEK